MNKYMKILLTTAAIFISTSANQVIAYDEEATWLKQNWSTFDRDWYYFQTQGSEIMSYKFFINLEQADNQKLFRDNEHMNELGYTTVSPSEANPDGLPIGFTRDRFKDKLGVNCAACHNGQINYKGKKIIVDGGVPLSDFVGLNTRLVAALTARLKDPAKFDRFARRVLAADYKSDNILALRRWLSTSPKRVAVRTPTTSKSNALCCAMNRTKPVAVADSMTMS